MVQGFCVVSCCFCQTYQGQQVKKEKKWTCKMCGEKQSFRKIFAQGTGKECRLHVQKLNMMKGNLNEDRAELSGEKEELITESEQHVGQRNGCIGLTTDSKWKQFITLQPELCDDGRLNSGDKDEDFFTTEREKLNKYKGQKRKNGNSWPTVQEGYKQPTKIQKCHTGSRNVAVSSQDLLSEFKSAQTYKKNVNTVDLHVRNKLQENGPEYSFKENEIANNLLLNSSSTSSIKTRGNGQAKPSKWSKFT